MWLIKMEETDELHHSHTTNVFESPEKAINSVLMLGFQHFPAVFFFTFGDNYDFCAAISTNQCNIFGLLVLYNTNYEVGTSKKQANKRCMSKRRKNKKHF